MYIIPTSGGFTVRSQEYNANSLTAVIDTTQYRILAYCDGVKTVKPSTSITISLIGIDLYQLTIGGLL